MKVSDYAHSYFQFLHIFTLGYFVSELLIDRFVPCLSSFDFWHHLVVICEIGFLSLKGGSFMGQILAMFYGEMSNLPMHFRGLLNLFGRRYTKAYVTSELIFFTVFIIARSTGGFHVYKYILLEWDDFTWFQIASIYSIVFGSLAYLKFMSFRIIRHFKGSKFEEGYVPGIRDLDKVDQSKSLRKQMSEYLTMCGKKRVLYWFDEEKSKTS